MRSPCGIAKADTERERKGTEMPRRMGVHPVDGRAHQWAHTLHCDHDCHPGQGRAHPSAASKAWGSGTIEHPTRQIRGRHCSAQTGLTSETGISLGDVRTVLAGCEMRPQLLLFSEGHLTIE